MSQQKKKLLLIILPILFIAIVGSIVLILYLNKEAPPDQSSDHIHEFSEWEIIEEATCNKNGIKERVCACGESETETITKLEHNYANPVETKNGESYVIQILCEYCNQASDFYARGMFLDNDNSMYLLDCPQNFTFEITSSLGMDYVKDNVFICESVYRSVDKDKNPDVLEKLIIESVSENTYRIKNSSIYKENISYYISLPENMSFANFPGKSMEFTISGKEICEIEYNDNILFLKQLELQNPGYYPYDLTFNDEDLYYTLSLSQAGELNQNYIGRLICIGECTNFIEAANLSTEVVIGKISAITYEEDSVKLKLVAPSLDEIYSKLNVSGGSVSYDATNMLSTEYQEYLTVQLLSSESFTTALTSATIAADNIAQTYNMRVVEKEFDIKDLEFKIKAEEVEELGADAKFKLNVTIEYKHSIPFEKNGEKLGSVDFTIEFDMTSTFKLVVVTNIDAGKLINNEDIMRFNCALYNNNSIEFDLKADLNLNYSVEVSSAIYYIQNPKSKKIHRSDCRMAVNYLTDESTHYYSYKDVTEIPDYISHECSWCKPFTISETLFVLNHDSNILHCGNCQYVSNMKTANISVYSVCPIGYSATNCDACKPQEHTKSVETYISESLSSGNWDIVFTAVQKTLGDKLKGTGASPITSDAKPEITLKFYCFEVPVYVEPQFDFDLKANFSFHFDAQREDAYILRLVYDENSGYSLVTSHNVLDPNGDEEDSHLTLDLQGKLRTELGILLEIRLGFLYTSKYCYIGVNGECGFYVDLAGVVHLDSSKENYYAAHIEAGIYCESNCVYAIPKILSAGGQAILKKTDFPLFESGDIRAYQSFLTDDPYIEIDQVNVKTLDDSLLKVSYFDLEDMKMKDELLKWNGSDAYSITFRFVDENGNDVSYCYVKNGILHIAEHAPNSFDITMYIGVKDNVAFDSITDYIFTKQKNGSAFFMEDLAVNIKYTSVPIPTADKTEIAPAAHPSGIYLTDEEVTFNITANLESTYGMALFCNDSQVDIAYADEMVLKDGKQTVSLHATFGGAGTHTIEARPLNQDGVPIKSAKKEAIVQITIHDKNLCTAPQITTASNQSLLIDHPFKIEWKRSPYPIDGITYSITVDYRGSAPWEYPLAGVPVDGTSYIIDASVFTKPGRYGITVYPVSTDPAITVPEGCYSVIGIDVVETCVVHTPISIPAVSATCTSNGLTEGTKCSTCDGIMSPQEETPLIPHNYINDQCTVCGKIRGISQGLTYVLNEKGTAYIVKGIGTCTDAEIIIPSTYQNLPVVGIADISFIDNEDIISITIPDSITYIGNQAFKNCTSLILIEFGSKLDTIGYDAFYQCTSLKELYIPANVKSIGDEAFYGCKKLTVVEIGDKSAQSTFTTIGQEAFEECVNLQSVYIGNGVSTIRQGAFSGCSSLEGVEFGNSIASIGDNAFKNCSSLAKVSIPKSIGKIGFRAFYSCSALKNIEFGGTTRMWKNVSKGNAWCDGSPVTTVKCSDGDADI